MKEPVGSARSITLKKPSLKLSILIIILNLFAIIPLVAGFIYVLVIAGFPIEIIKANSSAIILIAHICFIFTMTFYLVKRYSIYLLSEDWKANFIKFLSVGLKWSLPLLTIHIIALLIPSTREKLMEDYMSMRIISVKGISNIGLLIFSIWVLSGAIFEEILFRGILLQKLQKILNATLSVIIIASLFALSHFSFSHINLSELTNAFIIGLLSGFAFMRTRSCISAIVPHLLNNAMCIGFVLIIR